VTLTYLRQSYQHARNVPLRVGAIVGVLALLVFMLTACDGVHDAGADANVWEDTNCNGQLDEDEPPLEGICIWHGNRADSLVPYSEYCTSKGGQTNNKGRWSGGLLWNRKCTDVYIFVEIPDGFRPTTDVVVNDCFAEFGLAKMSNCPEISIRTPSDLIAQQKRDQVTFMGQRGFEG